MAIGGRSPADCGGVGTAIQDALDRCLDEGALLLHDDDLGESLGKALDDLGVERRDHAELEQPNPAVGQAICRDAE